MKGAAAAVFLLWAAAAGAAFRASDQGVVLGVGRIRGEHDANFLTDLFVYNAAAVPVRVDVAFLPTGGADNTAALSRLATLGPIAPGGTLVVRDVLSSTFGLTVGYGAILYFGSRADAPAVVAPVIVHARPYAAGEGSFGAFEPGLPYYDEANPSAAAIGANAHLLTPLEEDEAFRTNVGVWNGSDPTTSVVLALDAIDAQGRPVGSVTAALPPLAHRQFNRFLSRFGVSGAGFSVRIRLISSSSTSSGSRPYFYGYATVTDNRTDDPSFVEPAYPGEEPVDCIFP